MKIAIIGSGISGLYLSFLLKKKGYTDFDIYEKNNKIGGRIKLVDFENIKVIAGAGILRFNKDKLMYNLCKKLKVETHIYKTVFSYTFEPVNVLEIIEKLKDNLYMINGERYKYTFARYAKKILGNKEYNIFVKSCGLSDFEKADVIDTIYDYGFEDCISGYEGVSVKWQELLDAFYDMLKEHIFLNSPVKKIEKTVDNKFKIKNKIYDKVIITTDIKAVREYFLKNKIYKNVEGQPFVRLYVKLNKPIENYKKIIITENPFQKIIEINKSECIYMISYSDNKVANRWKNCTNIKKTVVKAIKRIFNIELKVLRHKLIYWKNGTQYFKPLPKEYKDRDDFLEIAQNPIENLFLVGEGLSKNQGWCEGSLESVQKIINNF
jgi:protoporphyrinogen oxidase